MTAFPSGGAAYLSQLCFGIFEPAPLLVEYDFSACKYFYVMNIKFWLIIKYGFEGHSLIAINSNLVLLYSFVQ